MRVSKHEAAWFETRPRGPLLTMRREDGRKTMFETLSERLGAILDKLTRKGALGEADVTEAMRVGRRAFR